MGSEEDMVWETEGVRGSEWEGYLHSRTGWWDWGGWAQRVKWRVFGPQARLNASFGSHAVCRRMKREGTGGGQGAGA